MNSHFDLHSHSIHSDGVLTPAELVARAATRVDVLALTDHDTTDGIAEACAASGDVDVEIVAGVELSVTWEKQSIHLLGLRIDPDNEALQSGLLRLQEIRRQRAVEIGKRLEKHGINGASEGARRLAGGRAIGRTHFARFLEVQGHVPTLRDAFKSFLTSGRPGHVPGNWATLEEATGWIRAAGGDAVIAHPARYRMSATKRRRLLGEFVELGGIGLEVVTAAHSGDDNRNMAQLAIEFGLYASVGSDFHDPDIHWADLGRLAPLPSECTPIWDTWPALGAGRQVSVVG